MTVASDWVHIAACMALHFRGLLPGTALTGTAALAVRTLTGTGTLFASEVQPGDWLRFEDRAYQVDTVPGNELITMRDAGVEPLQALTRLDVDVHDQVLRAEQGDSRILVKDYAGDIKDFPPKREVRLQVTATAPTTAELRALTAAVMTALPESGSIRLRPARDTTGAVLIVEWAKMLNSMDLGENNAGLEEHVINYQLYGRDG